MSFEDIKRARENAPTNVIMLNRFTRKLPEGPRSPRKVRPADAGLPSWIGIHPPVLQLSSPNSGPAIC